MRDLIHAVFNSRFSVYLFLLVILVGLWIIVRKLDMLE